MQWLAIGLGAAIGACLRGWLARFNPMHHWIPLGTLGANVLGGLLIGLALVWFERVGSGLSPNIRLFVITGFLGGSGNRPAPISEREVEKILSQMEEGVEKPRPKVLFEVGETVRVKEGPFADFNGNVEEVNYEKSKVRVSVTIFGRATPVELDFAQVEKV